MRVFQLFMIAGFLATLTAGSAFAGSCDFTAINLSCGITDPNTNNTSTDSLIITLAPLDGAIAGTPGQTVGWDFSAKWSSSGGDSILFENSYLSGETNASLLGSAGYLDYISGEGVLLGPLSGSDTTLASFDPVAMTGMGAYVITSDPGVAFGGAQDTGALVVPFEIVDPDGDVFAGTYYGPGLDVSVTVSPEPGTAGMLLGSLLTASSFLGKRKRR